jgi:5-(carboxyamino)imidazole ribonucleotide synthase
MGNTFFSSQKKVGILGGGQLGKMLVQSAATLDIYTKVLDPDLEAPARCLCSEFQQGNLQDFDTVYNFGKDCAVLTIEIEHVNVDALKRLQEEGAVVHPNPASLEIIKDKGLQKIFFRSNDLPTSDFHFYGSKEEILSALANGSLLLPFVQKSRTDGYDGRGVLVVSKESDLQQLMDVPCIVEDKIQVQTEIAIIAARNLNGEICCYDAVLMEFVEGINMLDFLQYPYRSNEHIVHQAKEIASCLIDKLSICGLLAVEFFVDVNNQLFINEVAPRPHNSGHQTIESSETSQYEQHLRGILNLPLGSVDVKIPSVMVNLLGADGYTGFAEYKNIETCMATAGVHVHIYGKKMTKPFRKMGHVTVTNSNIEEAKKIAIWVKQNLQVQSL